MGLVILTCRTLPNSLDGALGTEKDIYVADSSNQGRAFSMVNI